MKRLLIIWILGLFFINAHAGEYTISTVPNDHLADARDYVTNPDGIISAGAESEINQMIDSIQALSTAEIAVVLIESIGTDDPDDFATRLFESWGIGKDKKDNGLLFLLVYNQKKMVFRTGYGLEGVLPDAILSRIIRNDISPYLKQGDFDGGIISGISKVCEYLKNPEAVQEIIQREESQKTQKNTEIIYFYLFFSIVILAIFMLPIISVLRSNKTNYAKYLSMSGWKIPMIICAVIFPIFMIFFAIVYFIVIKRLRNKPIACPKCGNKMKKLSESEEDEYLTKSQQTEENIKSIDYDVWLCNTCGNKEILPYNKSSRYAMCPGCHAKTYFLANDYILKSATTSSSGKGEKMYSCKNCNREDIKPYIIPMIIIASSSGRGGGGFSGGGGGGGSWGGGSTGGGGASGGW